MGRHNSGIRGSFVCEWRTLRHASYLIHAETLETIQMKNPISKKLLYLTLAQSLVWFSSCQNFLKEDPLNRIAQDRYYSTEEDAVAAVNSVYANLGSTSSGPEGIYHSTTWITPGLASDEMKNMQQGAIANDQLATFAWNAENSSVNTLWRIHYKTITLANIAIERIPGINMDQTLRTRLVNEARFLRALAYFNLVRFFGQVPLLLSETEPLNPQVADVAAVYQQIIDDLKAAEGLPPDGDIQEGRATSGAAKALLAKVYLTLKDWTNASIKAKEVIESGKYGLWDDFGDVFKHANRGGKEAVFSVGFGDAGGTISFWEFGQFNVRLLPPQLSQRVTGVRNTQGWQVVTRDLYDSYADEDERKAVSFMTEFEASDGSTVVLPEVYIQKFWDSVVEPFGGDSQQDFSVIRYAEVLLIYAEAEGELGHFDTGNEYLNMIKSRANIPTVNITDPEAFREEILLERRKELVAEGHRWFDLVRTGKLAEKVLAAKNIQVNTMYNLFPIPQRERDVNRELPQNAGY